jgi:hypothetical protein
MARRRGVEFVTRPEEVSMHSIIMALLANEVERERQDERQKLHARSQALGGPSHGSTRTRAARRLGRRLMAAIKRRPAVGY